MKRTLALSASILGMALAAWAQPTTPLHTRVSVNWVDMTPAQALRDLGEKAKVEFAFDEALFRGHAPVTLRRDNVEAGRLAMRILRPCGLTLENADGNRPRIVKDDPYREFKPQREETFAFARKPALTRRGDDVTIAFETKAWCDVTVAIEHGQRIVRHLASGVLGLNAPEPFVWNSKAQTLVWDGKDDAGVYVDDKDAVTVRVSLGLKPQFERTLFWHPGKSAGPRWALAPANEGGAYVYTSGRGIDHLRLFDRDGNYARTVYPFPAAKQKRIPDLIRHRFPDGAEIPIKPNWLQTTLLQSGNNAHTLTYRDGRYSGHQSKGIGYAGMHGSAGNALAVAGETIALVGHRFSRLSARGDSGGMNLHGPDVAMHSETPLWRPNQAHRTEDALHFTRPKQAALSPDGQWLYLAAYNETHPGYHGRVIWQHMVRRIAYRNDQAEPELFAGALEAGNEPNRFNMPTDIACDSQGRVYVADHLNDRVQVFDSNGKLLHSLPIERPARLHVHRRTGEIHVFSLGQPVRAHMSRGTVCSLGRERENLLRLTLFPAWNAPKETASWNLQPVTGHRRTASSNMDFFAAMDDTADPPRVWITAPSPAGARATHGRGIMLLALENGEWTVKRDLLDETARAVVRTGPASYNRQRLYVNPADGSLYLLEMDVGKATKQALRIEPETGRARIVELPLSAEDMGFSREGHAYLKTMDMVLRYCSETWREIPFDYGEERQNAGFGSGSARRGARAISGAVFPANKGWHHGGMDVNVRGEIAVAALAYTPPDSRHAGAEVHSGTSYQPTLYPGRHIGGSMRGHLMVHIVDRHGRTVRDDAIPGLTVSAANGLGIDAQGDIYLLHAQPAMIGGERHFNDTAGTLMKLTPGPSRLLTMSGTPVSLAEKPGRPPDLSLPNTWVEGAHWMQPGIGWHCNYSTACACWNTRFSLDYFARSFAPEVDRCSVAVLDSAGNLLLRLGQYGNVDDGLPMVKDAADPRAPGGPPSPRSIGGDEIALKYAPYVATHTDRRLFIADPGNARILSVKIGYHEDHRAALKNVPDEGE